MRRLSMLDPDSPFTRPILWAVLLGMLVLLVVRSVRKDRREYQRFKRYRTTKKRQAMYRKWLLESFLSFGGLSALVLVLAWGFVEPLLRELFTWPGVSGIRSLFEAQTELVVGVIVAGVFAAIVLTVLGLRAARKETEVPTIGDIAAMLPRNRQEVVLGGLLSINAGVFEELLFRLALPALVFGATGSAVAAVLASVLLFGALHAYQGVAGIVGTTVVGAFMMLLYAVSGTIVVPIVVHALFDLRSLVLIPSAVYGAHRIDGVKHPITVKPRTPAKVAEDAAPLVDETPPAA